MSSDTKPAIEAFLKEYIRDIPDFPKEGIVFKDITPLLKAPEAYAKAVDAIAAPFLNRDIKAVICIEARGFIFGSAVARALDAGFVPIRKPGKLPSQTYQITYDLEYGQDSLNIHRDALDEGDRVIVVDDLLATGGTVAAATALLEKFDIKIEGLAFLVELSFLNGRNKLGSYPVHSVLSY